MIIFAYTNQPRSTIEIDEGELENEQRGRMRLTFRRKVTFSKRRIVLSVSFRLLRED